MNTTDKINQSVIELLELANINSPYTHHLLLKYRERLVDRLVAGGKIDADTADYLMG